MRHSSRKLTNEQYEERLHTVHGGSVLRLDDYVNSITPIKNTCPKGHIWTATPKDVIVDGKTGCAQCKEGKLGANIKWTHEKYEEWLSEAFPNLTATEPYVKMREAIEHECKICGHTRKTSPGQLRQMSRKNKSHCCAKCHHAGAIDWEKAGYLYFLLVEIEGQEYTKIGITTNLDKRLGYFNRKEVKIKDQILQEFEKVSEAHQIEQQLLKKFRLPKNQERVFDGYTELLPAGFFDQMKSPTV